MTHALRLWLDRLLGSGAAAVTVPPLDGALKPNNRIENAPPGIAVVAPDDIAVSAKGAIIVSSGDQLFELGEDRSLSPMARAGGEITAIAAAPSGLIAMATDPRGISFIGGRGTAGSRAWTGVSAMTFANDTTLLICIGSTQHSLSDWQRDLLDGGASGELWRLNVASGSADRLAAGLAFPYGVVVDTDGTIVVSESWAKRLVRLSADGKPLGQVMEDLPGYPARIARSERGGYWLAVFAPRSQLIEFVLREPAYRRAMMTEVDQSLWIAPALRSGVSLREPMQGGALKQMGVLKPWAPTRSYGLAVELSGDFEAIRSLHSRAGGKRHGITAATAPQGQLWLASKGGHELVSVALRP
jgi:Strictosidine synthase